MFLIAGLGNPGSEYDDTPHNIGFAAVNELANRAGQQFKRGPVVECASARLTPKWDAVAIRPLSYMNLSGRPVAAALRWFDVAPSNLIVVCDDVNLPFGKIRIRTKGGAGGQKGLLSILQTLGTDEVCRIRLGVGGGYPGADVGSHVLRKLRKSELETYLSMASTACDALELWFKEGPDAAMNRYNSPDTD
ncbi:aminoacyl-tRNA hydrolase [bacterium]|nr:aminoacyl-tRNA hydrolase [bacterium]